MKRETEETLGTCVVALLTAPFTVALSGWTLTVMWGWFITPLYRLPAPTIPQAIGLAMTVKFLTHQSLVGDRPAKEYREEPDILELIIVPVVYCSLTLLFGWVVKQFAG